MRLPFWANLNTLAAAIIVALLVYIGVQKVELLTCRLHQKDLQHQLELMSKAKNDQKTETQRNIDKGKERIVYVDRVAREIEKAPLPGNCSTPPQVLQADL